MAKKIPKVAQKFKTDANGKAKTYRSKLSYLTHSEPCPSAGHFPSLTKEIAMTIDKRINNGGLDLSDISPDEMRCLRKINAIGMAAMFLSPDMLVRLADLGLVRESSEGVVVTMLGKRVFSAQTASRRLARDIARSSRRA